MRVLNCRGKLRNLKQVLTVNILCGRLRSPLQVTKGVGHELNFARAL